jgi:hypothetical protein
LNGVSILWCKFFRLFEETWRPRRPIHGIIT